MSQANSQSNSQSMLKFRPVLTHGQVKWLAEMCTISVDRLKDTNVDVSVQQSIIRVLIPLLAKIEVGAINPAYRLSEIHAAKQSDIATRRRYEDGIMSASEEIEYESKILGI